MHLRPKGEKIDSKVQCTKEKTSKWLQVRSVWNLFLFLCVGRLLLTERRRGNTLIKDEANLAVFLLVKLSGDLSDVPQQQKDEANLTNN